MVVRPFGRTVAKLLIVAVTATGLLAGTGAGAALAQPAATPLPPVFDQCLRQSAANPGGVLVLSDQRLTASQADFLRQALATNGRPSCVARGTNLTVDQARAFWLTIPLVRRPDTLVVAATGTAADWPAWAGHLPDYRLLGTSDSGISAGSAIGGWTSATPGATAGGAILARLGEHTVYGGSWAGTKSSDRMLSPASQCAAALASPKGVYVLGDSVTAKDFAAMGVALKSRGYIPCLDAQFGARVYDYLVRMPSIKLPRNVVIALGNNDVFNAPPFRNDLWRMLLAVGAGRRVVVPTLWRSKPGPLLPAQQVNARAINVVINDLMRYSPTWASIDWAGAVQRHPEYQYDGIHLTRAGANLRYTMICDTLDALDKLP